MTPRTAMTIGAGLVLVILVNLFIMPVDALRAWLAATFLWSGVPVGSLALLMMIKLIGGRWGHSLSPTLEAGALTLPIIAAAAVPLIIGMRWLYPWATQTAPGFKGAWLAPLPFAVRAVLLFAGAGALLWLLVARRLPAAALAAAGLCFLVPMMSLVAVDWLVSLDRDFHSSGFGLYAWSIQFCVALSVATWILLGRQPKRTATLGALLLAVTLISLYLAFTSYFIIWSGDLAPLVGWYAVRGTAGWGAAYAVVIGIELIALVALFFRAVRVSPRLLRGIAGGLIVAKTVESAWIVLPQGERIELHSSFLFLLAAIGLGLITVSAQNVLLDRRLARRTSNG